MNIQLSSGDATTLGKVLGAAISDDKIKQHLRAIHIASVTAGELSFTATDSFIAYRVTVNTGLTTPLEYDIVIDGVTLSNALVQAGKLAGKNGKVELSTAYNNVVTVTTTSFTVECNILDLDVPPLDSILADVVETTGNVLFNGTKLTGIVKAATLVAGKNGVITFETMNTHKPGRITADSETLAFTGVIMPCRTMADSRR